MDDRTDPRAQLAELAEIGQLGSTMEGPDQVRARGARRERRRRAGWVAGSATAVVALAGVTASVATGNTAHVGGVTLSAAAAPAASSAPSARPSPRSTPVTAVSAGPAILNGAGPTPSSGFGSLSTHLVLSRDATNFNATFRGAGGYPDIFALGVTGPQVTQALQNLGFSNVGERQVSSGGPAGEVIDIENAQHSSLLGRSITVQTRVTLVVSSGPSN